jgi:hypothetical protein
MNFSNVAALAMLDENNRLLTLSFSDILPIAIYFVMVLGTSRSQVLHRCMLSDAHPGERWKSIDVTPGRSG